MDVFTDFIVVIIPQYIRIPKIALKAWCIYCLCWYSTSRKTTGLAGEGKWQENVKEQTCSVRIGNKYEVINILKNKHLCICTYHSFCFAFYRFMPFPSEIVCPHVVYNPVSRPALGDAKYLMTPHLETINTFEWVLGSWGKGCWKFDERD